MSCIQHNTPFFRDILNYNIVICRRHDTGCSENIARFEGLRKFDLINEERLSYCVRFEVYTRRVCIVFILATDYLLSLQQRKL